VFEAWVWIAWDGQRLRKRFAGQREAKAWGGEIRGAVCRGQVRAPTRKTIDQPADELVAGVKAGTIVNRSGRPYKPSAVRGYDRSPRLRIRPDIGSVRLSQVDRARVRLLIPKWVGDGQTPSTRRGVGRGASR
jgi:hypothetical protein